MQIFTATAGDERGWEFMCPLHASPYTFYVISGPNHAISVMKAHMDDEHPGVKMRLQSISNGVTLHATYMAVTNLPTGDIL